MKGKIAWLVWYADDEEPVLFFSQPDVYYGYQKVLKIVYFEVEDNE